MITWLFWPCVVLLVMLLPAWMIATFCPGVGVRIACFGSVQRKPPEFPAFLRRLTYPKDGC